MSAKRRRWQTGAIDGRARHSGVGDVKETRNNLANHFGWSVRIAINLDNARTRYWHIYVGTYTVAGIYRFIRRTFYLRYVVYLSAETFSIFDLGAHGACTTVADVTYIHGDFLNHQTPILKSILVKILYFHHSLLWRHIFYHTKNTFLVYLYIFFFQPIFICRSKIISSDNFDT